MRLEQQTSRQVAAPPDAISVAMFKEIDGAIKLRAPSFRNNLTAILIDQEQGSGLQNWIHRPVRGADNCIMKVAILYTGEKIEWHFPQRPTIWCKNVV